MIDTFRVCSTCQTKRRTTDVLAVIDTATGSRRYVCRPTLHPPCFGNVKAATAERIELPGDPRNAA